MSKVVLYPGTFDPFHAGHKDVILRTENQIPDHTEFVVLVQNNRFKHDLMFSHDFRTKLVKSALSDSDSSRRKFLFTGLDTLYEWLEMYKELRDIPTEDITIVIGDDCLVTLSDWYNFHSELNKYKFAIAQRTRSIREIKLLATDLITNYTIIRHTTASIELGHQHVSSTKIREQVKSMIQVNN